MGRLPRIHYSGAVYHAMARGVDGRDIYIDELDRTTFLAALGRLEKTTASRVLAYCLMGNHFHLAIQIGKTPLASIMQRLLGGYSLAFNKKNQRTGHLFQARYKALLCTKDDYLFRLTRYIHQNPVRAGLVEHAGDWPWSSVAGKRAGVEVDVDLTGFDPWREETTPVSDLMRFESVEPPSLEELALRVASKSAISVEELRSDNRGRSVIAARSCLTQTAVESGYKLIEIARWLNTTSTSVGRYTRRTVNR